MDKKTISISSTLYAELESAMKKMNAGTEQDMNTYVEQLLKEALHEEQGKVYKTHDEEAIKDRLKSLGYID